MLSYGQIWSEREAQVLRNVKKISTHFIRSPKREIEDFLVNVVRKSSRKSNHSTISSLKSPLKSAWFSLQIFFNLAHYVSSFVDFSLKALTLKKFQVRRVQPTVMSFPPLISWKILISLSNPENHFSKLSDTLIYPTSYVKSPHLTNSFSKPQILPIIVKVSPSKSWKMLSLQFSFLLCSLLNWKEIEIRNVC